MTHFAKIEDNLVVNVIVAEQDYIDNHAEGTWLQTSYNTHGGIHYGQDGEPDGGAAIRKNFAGLGSIYDPVADAFCGPQVFPSWKLDADTYLWEPPVAYPDDGKNYRWDEDTTSWVEIEI